MDFITSKKGLGRWVQGDVAGPAATDVPRAQAAAEQVEGWTMPAWAAACSWSRNWGLCFRRMRVPPPGPCPSFERKTSNFGHISMLYFHIPRTAALGGWVKQGRMKGSG